MFKSMMRLIKGALIRMGLIKKIKTLSDVRSIAIDASFYEHIEQWQYLYKGYYPKWHDVRYVTLGGERKRKMLTMNMPKTIAQEMATLVFNERCEINISDDGLKEWIDEILDENKFFRHFQNYLEYQFSMGGMVIKPYYEGGKLKLAYVTADCFVPVAWDNSGINEGVFVNTITKGQNRYMHLEWHLWEGGVYTIKNELYKDDNLVSLTTDGILPEDLEPEARIPQATRSWFVYFSSNTANNVDIGNPLGVPIFSHSLDTLRSLDTAFDSFEREFRLGRRRIIVPATAVNVVVDSNGKESRYFDANDEVYQAMQMGADPAAQKIYDNTVGLRVEEHIGAINSLLNILAMQCGFSTGTFTFDGASVKTATEVISENSKTFRTKQSHEIMVDANLSSLVDVLVEMGAVYGMYFAPEEYKVKTAFDDSIAEDRTAEVNREIMLVGAQLQTRLDAIIKIYGITEEEAAEKLAQINEENASANSSTVDMIGFD